MKELYDLLKRIKEEKGLEVKIIISLTDDGLAINDIANVKNKNGKLCIGGGAIEGDDMDEKHRAIIKAMEHEYFQTDDELNLFDNAIEKDTIGCFDMSPDTMYKNNYGSEVK